MTIRRQWMLVLVLSVVLTVAVNSAVFGTLMNRYFVDYSKDNYNKHVAQIVDFSKKVLLEDGYSAQQIKMQLETHLSDPIKEIKLYDAEGDLLGNAISTGYQTNGYMGSRMMNRMMGKASEEVDAINITDQNDRIVGQLNITRYSALGNSLAARKYMVFLIGSSLLSFGIAFVLIFLLGAFFSRKMTKEMRMTAQMATDMDLGNGVLVPHSKVKEIRIIQQSLENLQTRLKLKQTSRKKLIDELVHQTRTPLAILQAHLEAMEDGVVKFSPEEIRICEAQIQNITSIIANMSGMIDGESDLKKITLETVDISHLLKQIVGGLKVQFLKKNIELIQLTHGKTMATTDQYLLSQAIYNILTNAYKYTDPRGRVTVECTEVGKNVSIVIEDTGRGILPSEQDRIFDAYYKSAEIGNTEGEGIGLYVAKENLKQIGGTIRLESEVGKGSRFIVEIPKAMQICGD